MSYATEMHESGLDVRRRLGLWKPFEPVKWRPVTPKPEPTEEDRARAAHVARCNARRLDIIERIEIQRGIFSPLTIKMRPGAAILAETAAKHRLTIRQIKMHRRGKAIVAARCEAMWRMSEETGLSLPQIGQLCGGFDHTSVIHGIRKHAAFLQGRVYRRKDYHRKSQVSLSSARE